MAKRLHEIAKELGVTSKAIIDKCVAEGIPPETVKNHMAVIKVGLEATIREWFATGSVATAVETTEHVDLDKVRAKPRGRRAGGHDSDGENGVATATPDSPDQSESAPPTPAEPTVATRTIPAPPAAAGAQAAGPAAAAPAAPLGGPTTTPMAAPMTGPGAGAASGAGAPVTGRGDPAGPSTTSEAPSAAAPATAAGGGATAPPAGSQSARPIPAARPLPGARPLTGPNVGGAANSGGGSGSVSGGSGGSGGTTLTPVTRPVQPPTPLSPAARAGDRPLGPRAAGPVVPAAPAAPGPTDRRVAAGPAGPTTAPTQEAGAAPRGAEGGGQAEGGGAGAPTTAPRPPVRPGAVQGPRVIRPAPMNVPQRPTTVAPAGPQLQIKTPVKMAGPRLVRIEAPEQIDVRAPRRPGAGPGGPPRSGGRGVIESSPGAGGDSDAARRNKRRTGPDSAAAPARRRPVKGSDDVPVGTGFSEADLAEREARLARSGGYLKQRRREMKARTGPGGERALSAAETGGKVQIVAPFTIKDLSAATGVKSADILKKLFMQGVMATVNSGIDADRASEIMIDFDIELEVTTAKTAEQVVSEKFESRERQDERPRSPIVTIMGHVDHGKTSLLDAIRKTNVASGEAGGITQKTSAFKVAVDVEGETKHVVFIDTPGHEAFSEMRSRGAIVTDIVVLVVGAPESVMPQTVESINHARAAKVPIVVALNKIDSPQATEGQVQKILGQLAEKGLNPVEWGGETEIVRTSATKGIGIQELLQVLDLQAQILELKADFAGPARGRVIEATVTEGRGPTAVVMVQEGELKVGDYIVAGKAFGRVRDITDDTGKRIREAGPSTPVQISGIDEVPAAGDPFFVTDSLKKAQEAAEQRRDRDRAAALHQPKVTLDSFFSQMKDADVKEILVVLKADVQGSVDVIKNQIEKLSTEEVKVRVLHAAVGGIQESDVLLADASKAVIVGFNAIPGSKARSMAEQKGVEVRTYQVIYDIVEDVRKAATGMLEPEIRQEILGHADVRKVFKVTKVGNVAGCYVTDGMVQRDAFIRVTRGGIVIENDRVLEQLKRVKDDAKEVKAGMECGMKIVGYDDIKEGDVLECYKKVEVKRTL